MTAKKSAKLRNVRKARKTGKKPKQKIQKKVKLKKKNVEMEEEAIIAKGAKSGKTIGLLRGMKDILPKEDYIWRKLYRTAEQISRAYGFSYMETPILEDASLFIRSLGRGTDVVEKEMYVFEDKDGSRVCLRPEVTASIARAYINHGMHTYQQPVKVWYYGPMFRHDRPQAGRYREFHQFGCESIGSRDPAMDAELIVVAYNFLRDLGIATNVHINSLGNLEDRQRYIVELVDYLRTKRGYLCEDCKRRMNKNPLRVLDCKAEQCQPIIEEAPQIIDFLNDEAKAYFTKVLEYLDELDVPYVLKHNLVRGLEYYTDTVFEIYEEELDGGDVEPNAKRGSQSALCGGGRYDLLIEQLGGAPAPACGFSVGLERVVSILKKQAEEKKLVWSEEKPKVFFAQLGEQARRKALRLIEDLRRHNVIVCHNLGKSALKAQLELANKFQAVYVLILGQKEVQDGTIIIRDMESGIQEIVDQKKLKQQLEKKFGQLGENSG